MKAILIVLLMFGADDLAELRQTYGPLMAPSAGGTSGALQHVDGVWDCKVWVDISRRMEEVTGTGNTRSSDEQDQLQELLRPLARKAGKAAGLINPRLDATASELEITVNLYPVDEESEDLWGVEVRAALLVPARTVRGNVSLNALAWEMTSRGAVPRADLETVLAKAVERSVKAAAGSVKDARSRMR